MNPERDDYNVYNDDNDDDSVKTEKKRADELGGDDPDQWRRLNNPISPFSSPTPNKILHNDDDEPEQEAATTIKYGSRRRSKKKNGKSLKSISVPATTASSKPVILPTIFSTSSYFST